MNNKLLLNVIGFIMLIVVGFLIYRFYGPTRYAYVKSFQDCEKAGLPILESFPARCSTPDGRTFTQKLTPRELLRRTPPQQICQNKCGDNICQEIVCQATGCPCGESVQSCPVDCVKAQ